tara:strand:+ start:480 stop:1088 length:609 start_codon:yes stop_codon:yes gene_type:complete
VAGNGVDLVEVPVLQGTPEALDGYGYTFDDPAEVQVEIVRWPAGGWRPVDPDTGDEGGTVEGVFDAFWEGSTLRALNSAVDGDYLLAEAAGPPLDGEPWLAGFTIGHLNYHPDGGQLFFPLDPGAFVVPLALPGDGITPADVVAFWFDGTQGLCIHPEIWHEGVFPLVPRQRFLDRQGRVHARVSVELADEFGCRLLIPGTL